MAAQPEPQTPNPAKKPKPTRDAFVPTDGSASGTSSTLKAPACPETCFVGELDRIAAAALAKEFEDRETDVKAAKKKKKKGDPDEPVVNNTVDEQIGQILALDSAAFHVNLVGLRRAKSITNLFDDALVMLYRVPHVEKGDKKKFVLPIAGDRDDDAADELEKKPRRKVNEDAARAFVDKVAGRDHDADWPTSGDPLHCPVHGYWKAIAFAGTSDPGYSSGITNDARDVPWGIAAVETQRFGYRCGFHHFAKWSGFVAGQAVSSVPGTRRYPIKKALDAAVAASDLVAKKAARDAVTKAEEPDARTTAATNAKARASEQALAEVPDDASASPKLRAANDKKRASLEKKYTEKYKGDEYDKEAARLHPEVGPAAARKARYATLAGWVSGKLSKRSVTGAIIRIEDKNGERARDFEHEKKKDVTLAIEPAPGADGSVAGDAKLVLNIGPVASPEKVVLGEADVLVTRAPASGTNFHRSVDRGARGEGLRTVQNYSEGCQVFRDPDDFYKAVRILQLSKRVQCAARCDTCTAAVTLDLFKAKANPGTDMDDGIVDASKGQEILQATPRPGAAATGPAPDVSPAVDGLRVSTGKAVAAAIQAKLGKKSLKATPDGDVKAIVDDLLKDASRAPTPPEKKKVDAAAKAAVAASRAAWEAGLDAARDDWLTKNRDAWLQKKLDSYVADHAEACDFAWTCKVQFPYALLEVTEDELKKLLNLLPSYGFDALFAGRNDKLDGKRAPDGGDDE